MFRLLVAVALATLVPAPPAASVTLACDAPAGICGMFEEALSTSPPVGEVITVTLADVPVPMASSELGVVLWPATDYGGEGWWLDAVVRHEVAHLLSPVHGHGPEHRAIWDQLLEEIDVVATYTPGQEYPRLERVR